MRYIPHTENDIQGMLEVVGVPRVESLFDAIPEKHRLDRLLDIPAALSEQELIAELSALSQQNANAESHHWFLGAGTYAHFTPSAIDSLSSRAEFLTAYTPYQPELSQGTLQAIFEWQTMISSLTGLEVANASMYDGASAVAEAALMSMRITRRSAVLVAPGLHPHYLGVLRTYLSGLKSDLRVIPEGTPVEDALDDSVACVIQQRPDFFGRIPPLRELSEKAHAHGILVVSAVTEALSLALLAPPGELGADIVCGEAQSFGVGMSLGGPHLGFLAANTKHVRQIPGRLAGQTVDTEGRRGFVLTLSTREQHIRRERATSNICTNQGLCLLRATIYLSLLGRVGLARLAELNFSKAEYAKTRVRETRGLELIHEAPTFNEFAVRVPDSGSEALTRALDAGAVGGLDLKTYAPELGPAVLVCTTELASREAIDSLVTALAGGSA